MEVKNEKVVFEDYIGRTIELYHEEFLAITKDKEKAKYLNALKDGLLSPNDVWWNVKDIDENRQGHPYYKYIKIYKNGILIIIVAADTQNRFRIRDFYGYESNKEGIDKAEKERRGVPVYVNQPFFTFKDYKDREIKISQNRYAVLMCDEQRCMVRPLLNNCIESPSEVWLTTKKNTGKECLYYKYIKILRVGIVVACITDDLQLDDFYGYTNDKLDEAEKERSGEQVYKSFVC